MNRRHDGGDMSSMAGMDSDGMSSSAANMSMNMYFSTGLPSMPLWFESWQPTNAGSTFGACLGLAGVAVLFRLLGAIRAQAERAWAQRAEGALRIEYEGIANGASTPGLKEDVKVLESAPLQPDGAGDRRVASSAGLAAAKKAARDAVRNGGIPFVWSQELSRALITTVWVGVGYFLMLAVMSLNVWFFLAVLVGTFVGELLFGRYGGVGH